MFEKLTEENSKEVVKDDPGAANVQSNSDNSTSSNSNTDNNNNANPSQNKETVTVPPAGEGDLPVYQQMEDI